MKVKNGLRERILASGALSIALVVAGCGGRSVDESGTTVDAGLGGWVGSGGSSASAGGSVGSTSTLAIGGRTVGNTVAPRPPAIHRERATSCVGVHSPPEPTQLADESTQCRRHADCTAGKNGKCVAGIGMAWDYGWCVYDQCDTDANCDPGKVCYCSASDSARCLSVGNCQTDVDCATGAYRYCSPAMGSDCSGHHSVDSFKCHTAADSCMDDSDCSNDQYCNFDIYEGRWVCMAPNSSCAIG